MPIKKRLRISIDFTVEIADTPPLLPEGTIEPPDPEYDGRQARLLEAVKSNPEMLMRWMKQLIADNLEVKHAGYWENALTGHEDIEQAEIVLPAIRTLDEHDQAYFSEMKEMGLGYESMDMFRESFAVMEELPVIEEERHRTVFRAGSGKIPAYEEFS